MSKNVKLAQRLILLIVAAFIGNAQAFANDIVVTLKDGKCVATIADEEYRCALGRSGITDDKHEGDGTTPRGKFALRRVFYRADKIADRDLRGVSLPLQQIKTSDGWSDDPRDTKQYNKLVNLNSFDKTMSYEELYRKDDLYNIVIEVGYNDDPIIPNKGSAVFIRVSKPDYSGTAGGVVFSQDDLLEILPELDAKSKLIVE